MEKEAMFNELLDQALSELASIVSEEIIGEDELTPGFSVAIGMDAIRNDLRAKQRDQLSNRRNQND